MLSLLVLFENKYDPIKRNSNYKDYPEWSSYIAVGIVCYLAYVLLKNNVKSKK